MMTFSQYYTTEGEKIPVGSNQFAALSDDFVMAKDKVKKVKEVKEEKEKEKEKKVKRDKGQK